MSTGRYRSEWLVNLGSNRWSYKPEIGLAIPLGRWTVEGYTGVWIFTNNDAFFPGASLREQACSRPSRREPGIPRDWSSERVQTRRTARFRSVGLRAALSFARFPARPLRVSE